MMFSMFYNGIDLSGVLIIQSVSGRGPFTQEINRLSVSGRDGSHRMNRRIPERPIDITCAIVAVDGTDLRNKIDYLNGILYTNNAVPNIFFDEPDITYFGEYEGDPAWEDFRRHGRGTLPFICYDPYKYGKEIPSKISVPGDPNITIPTTFAAQASGRNYYGSFVDAQPILEIEFDDSASEYKITHQETGKHLRVIYDFSKGDRLLLDSTTRKVEINGNNRLTALSLKSEWFTLIEGMNRFVIEPDGKVETILKYRERWL